MSSTAYPAPVTPPTNAARAAVQREIAELPDPRPAREDEHPSVRAALRAAIKQVGDERAGKCSVECVTEIIYHHADRCRWPEHTSAIRMTWSNALYRLARVPAPRRLAQATLALAAYVRAES